MMTEVTGSMFRVGDMSEALKRIATMMHVSMLLSFDMGGGVEKWEPLKHRKGKPLVVSGALRASGVATSGADFAQVTAGRGIVYALIHQFGGLVHPRVTARSRAFFWAKYFETGDPMWKATALKFKVGQRMEIRIPARPFLAWIPEEVERYKEILGKAAITFEPVTVQKRYERLAA